MADRVRREFSDADIERIAGTYRRWRAKPETLEAQGWMAYEDEAGFANPPAWKISANSTMS